MKEIKYEAVFGDQLLFNDVGLFTGIDIITRNVYDGLYRSSRLSDSTPETLRKNPIVAMRRIIKEPKRWTWEDKKAGRLPDVGCSAVFMLNDGVIPEGNIYNWENGDEIEILKVLSGAVACVYNKSKKWAANISMTSIKPIETPEELAAPKGSE